MPVPVPVPGPDRRSGSGRGTGTGTGTGLVVLAVLVTGCRQILGIPGDFGEPGLRVGGTITGATGASAAMVYLSIDGVQVDSVAVAADGPLDLFADEPGAYAVTADPTCTVRNGAGTLGGDGVDDVMVLCDGLSSLATLGLSSPVATSPAFAPHDEAYTLGFSILTQLTTLEPARNYADASIDEVRSGGSVYTPAAGRYGPIDLVDASQLVVEVSHRDAAPHVYVAMTSRVTPAEFGYGKPGASEAGSWFGAAVAASGDAVVAGSPERASQTGEAFVFRRTGQSWVEEARLVASDAADDDRFGASVAIDGDVIAIGAPGAGGNSGAAYLYRKVGTTWTESRVAPTGSDDLFGTSVAVAGDIAVIGAPGENAEAGAAYVFEWTGAAWTQRVRLTAPAPQASARFGTSVAAHADWVIVGAPYEAAGPLAEAGAVHAFPAPAWTSPVTLSPSPHAAGDHLGTAVAIAADGTLAVGAPGGTVDGIPCGRAYVFDAVLAQTDLLAPPAGTGDANDGFGAAIAIAGRVVAVGAPQEDSGAAGTPDESAAAAGAAFVFELDASGSVIDEAYLKASNIGAGDEFGTGVALTMDQLVVGAPFEDSGTNGWHTDSSNATNAADQAGALYAFR
jgi:hypothetical protein